MPCPLCSSPGPFDAVPGPEGRVYYECPGCRLIFLDEKFLPSPEKEKERYAKHRNTREDAGYVAFLEQALAPTQPHLTSSMRGLDYGCGPAPVLGSLLRERGYACEVYDPFFFPILPPGPFDFIFATEVLEHLHRPGRELERIGRLLAPGGIFTVMTEPWANRDDFAAWPYASDFTHVCFYHARTIDYICAAYGFTLLHHAPPRVWVLQKLPVA